MPIKIKKNRRWAFFTASYDYDYGPIDCDDSFVSFLRQNLFLPLMLIFFILFAIFYGIE